MSPSRPQPADPPPARRRALLGILYGALVALYALHNDLWLWHDGRFVLGLPAGLAYHVAYCLAAAALMALLVRYAWPAALADEAPGDRHGAEDGR